MEQKQIKSNREFLIELRDEVAKRVITYRANLAYWQEVSRTAKTISQDKVDATNNITGNETSIKKDTLFLKCIDTMIKNEK